MLTPTLPKILDDRRKPLTRYGAMGGALARGLLAPYTTSRDATHLSDQDLKKVALITSQRGKLLATIADAFRVPERAPRRDRAEAAGRRRAQTAQGYVLRPSSYRAFTLDGPGGSPGHGQCLPGRWCKRVTPVRLKQVSVGDGDYTFGRAPRSGAACVYQPRPLVIFSRPSIRGSPRGSSGLQRIEALLGGGHKRRATDRRLGSEMVTLYQQHDSGNCYKVRLLLAHLGRAYRTVSVSSLDGATRNPEFLAKNPIGKVPTVQLDDGRFLAEFNAILLHFAEGGPLLPSDKYDRAKAYEWLFFEQYIHEPAIAVRRALAVYPERRAQATPERMAMLLEAGNEALSVMERRLASAQWLAGSSFSVADISLYAYTHMAHEGGFELANYPGIIMWLERVRAMPGHTPIDKQFEVDDAGQR